MNKSTNEFINLIKETLGNETNYLTLLETALGIASDLKNSYSLTDKEFEEYGIICTELDEEIELN